LSIRRLITVRSTLHIRARFIHLEIPTRAAVHPAVVVRQEAHLAARQVEAAVAVAEAIASKLYENAIMNLLVLNLTSK